MSHEWMRITAEGRTGVFTTAPRGWLHVAGVGMIESRPNWWRRFWAWALLGWRWEEKEP